LPKVIRRSAMTEERLQKVLAKAGVGSRRRAESYIASGRVTVNGQVVTELGIRVDPQRDAIVVDGTPIEREVIEYWALNKPPGVITTVEDPWGRPSARSLVPTQARVYPVGRLDADSAGLLLFTNDGALAYRLTHPRFEHEKEYRVLVDRRPDAATLRRLRRGVLLEGKMTAAAEVDVVATKPGAGGRPSHAQEGVWLRMVLHEGRKRQIRHMLDLVGHPVRALVRVRIGPVHLGDLPEGDARRLSPEERLALRNLVLAH
jgi:23S rRNA pseudouridine2605 synthase